MAGHAKVWEKFIRDPDNAEKALCQVYSSFVRNSPSLSPSPSLFSFSLPLSYPPPQVIGDKWIACLNFSHFHYTCNLDHSSKILWSKFESSIVPNIVASRAKPLKLGGLDSSMHWIRAAWPSLPN